MRLFTRIGACKGVPLVVESIGRNTSVASIYSTFFEPEMMTRAEPLVTIKSPIHVCKPGKGSTPIKNPCKAPTTGSMSMAVLTTTGSKYFTYPAVPIILHMMTIYKSSGSRSHARYVQPHNPWIG